MNKKNNLLFCALCISSLSYAQQVDGSVTDAQGQPLADVSVLFGKGQSTKTNSNGRYQITLMPGSYEPYASYLQKKVTTSPFTIQQHETKQIDFQFDDINHQMDEVVVVANRKPTNIADIPGTVWVINNDQIRQQYQGGVPLKEMLGLLIPGMDIGPQGRTNYGQNMRGRPMLVMIDGVSLNSLRGISRQLDAIDPFNIERIEVLSGASSIYGGNATGGIINIITKKAKENGIGGSTELGIRSGARHSNDADWHIAQSLQTKTDKFDGRIGVAYQQNRATYGANNQQIFTDISQTDLQYNRSIDLQGSLGYKFNEKHKISGFAQYYNSAFNGNRSLYLGENMKAFQPGNGDLLEMRDGFQSSVNPGTKRWTGIINYNATQILGDQDLYVQIANRSENIDFYPFPNYITLQTGTTIYNSSSRQNTNYTGIKALLNKNFEKINLTYGIDADFETFYATQSIYDIDKALQSGGLVNEQIYSVARYPKINSTSLAGYLQADYNILERLKLSAGVRYQNSHVKVSDFIGNTQQALLAFGTGKTADVIPGGKSNYGMTSINASLLYKIQNNQQTWLSYSEGIALADPAKYFGYGKYNYDVSTEHYALQSSVNIAEAKLQGVKTNQWELGYRLGLTNLKVQISGFMSQSNKSVESDRSTYQILVKDNPIRNIGIESQIDYTWNNLLLGANALIINSKNKIDGEWKQQDVTYASQNKLNVYLGYTINRFSTRLQYMQLFKLNDEDKNPDNALMPYNTLDWIITYNSKIGRFNLGIQNLLNKTYQTVWSKRAQLLYAGYKVPEMFYYQGRGRTFTINYSFNF